MKLAYQERWEKAVSAALLGFLLPVAGLIVGFLTFFIGGSLLVRTNSGNWIAASLIWLSGGAAAGLIALGHISKQVERFEACIGGMRALAAIWLLLCGLLPALFAFQAVNGSNITLMSSIVLFAYGGAMALVLAGYVRFRSSQLEPDKIRAAIAGGSSLNLILLIPFVFGHPAWAFAISVLIAASAWAGTVTFYVLRRGATDA